MTDEQKIEKLAKWLDNYYVQVRSGLVAWIMESDDHSRPWNPLTNIADAWMLVEKAQNGTSSALGDDYDEGHCILAKIADIPFAELKSSEVASAISEAALEA